MKKIILIFTLLFSYFGVTYAWVVPGTIQKGSYESNIFCTAETKTYSPTWWTYSCSMYYNARNAACWVQSYNTCTNAACWVASYNYNSCATSTCWVASYTACWYANDDPSKTQVCATWSTCSYAGYTTTSCTTNYKTCAASACWIASTNYKTCATSACWVALYNSCRTAANGCEQYSSSAIWTDSYTNYTDKEWIFYFSQSGNNIKLGNDVGQSCNAKATVNVTHIAPTSGIWYCPMWNCNPSSISIKNEYSWRHAQCTTWYSRDNLVTSFDQLWNIQRQYTSYQNKQVCKVEWRYATWDSTAPTVSINSVWNVFTDDIETWCNITRYKGASSSTKDGCEKYRARWQAGFWADLLKWLEITIWSDPSWIGSVNIILWACNATYTPNATDLNSILASTTSPSWVKSQYTNGFIIKYDASFTALWKSQPSLLSLFGKSRLDECFDEGQNLLIVEAKDMARSENDGISINPNSEKIQKWTVNIDNSPPKVKLSGDLTNTSDIWRNYTLEWNIEQWEVYKWGWTSTCNSYSWSLVQCPWTLTGGQKWLAPTWVDANTWKFMQYSCNGQPGKPSINECKMWCIAWQDWNPNTLKCEVASCKATVGGKEVVIEHGVNGIVSGSSCMAYCIPGHSLNCVVKWSAPVSIIAWVCWGSNGANLASIPTSNLCNSWTPSAVSGNWPWSWTCNGLNGGANSSCTAIKSSWWTPWTCGSSHNTSLSTAPTWNLCNSWTPSTVTWTWPWTWSCNGSNGGSTDFCSASKTGWWDIATTHGVCWTTHNTTIAATPTTNLCNSWTPSSVTWTWPWTWNCTWTNGWETVNCIANKQAENCMTQTYYTPTYTANYTPNPGNSNDNLIPYCVGWHSGQDGCSNYKYMYWTQSLTFQWYFTPPAPNLKLYVISNSRHAGKPPIKTLWCPAGKTNQEIKQEVQRIFDSGGMNTQLDWHNQNYINQNAGPTLIPDWQFGKNIDTQQMISQIDSLNLPLPKPNIKSYNGCDISWGRWSAKYTSDFFITVVFWDLYVNPDWTFNQNVSLYRYDATESNCPPPPPGYDWGWA